MVRPRLIGLYSPMPRCGKTSVAHFLEREGNYSPTSFAAPMKLMVGALLRYALLGGGGLEALESKESPIEVLPGAPSYRKLLRTLGTEWGRQQISPDFWVGVWRRRAERLLAAHHCLVVDDMRFPEELEAVRSLGGQLWLVRRSGFDEVPAERHASDGGLEGLPIEWDEVLFNDGTLEELQEQVHCRLLSTVSGTSGL